MIRFFILFIAMVFFGQASAQEWRDAASAFDRDRLDSAPSNLTESLAEARAGGSAADIAKVDALLTPFQPIDGEALQGDWKIRSVKLGGLVPLTI
ncbi:MAG: DUF4893 domain-containing protein [Pseudomonadota bacterium]